MEIISGKYKGRKLIAPTGETRPTLARVKSSIFSMIDEYIRGYRILDLFAGSGAMGLECVSRGAYKAVLVDSSVLAENAVRMNMKNMGDGITFLRLDYLDALGQLASSGESFDVVFLDPPYNSDYAQIAADQIIKKNLLCEGGIIVHERLTLKPGLILPSNFKRIKSKTYADKTVDIFIFKE